MKKLWYLLAAVMFVLSGCSNDENKEQVAEMANPFARFKAAIEHEQADSRLLVNADNTLSFSEGDVARIFLKDGNYYNYAYNNTGYFEPLYPNDEIPSTTTYNDIIGACFNPVESDGDNGIRRDGNGNLTGNLLDVSLAQSIEFKNLPQNSLMIPMWGTLNNGELYFKHLAGVLRVDVTGLPEGYDFLTIRTSNPIVGGTAVVEDITAPEPVVEIIEGGENLTYIQYGNTISGSVYVCLPVGYYEYIRIEVSKYNPDNAEGVLDDPILLGNFIQKTVERAKIYTAIPPVSAIDATTPDGISDFLKNVANQQVAVIKEEVDATASAAGKITIPTNLNQLTLAFEKTPVTDNVARLIIESDPNTAPATTASKSLNVNMPDDADNLYLKVFAPTSSVSLNNGTYAEVEASTADQTLIIEEGTIVENAIIHNGSVRVFGELKNIVSQYSGTLTIYKEIGGTVPANLPVNVVCVDIAKEKFLAEVADANDNSIQLYGNITLDEPIQINSDKNIYLDGFTIDFPQSDGFIVTNGTLDLYSGNVYCNSANTGDYSVVRVDGANAKATFGNGIFHMQGTSLNCCIYVGENGGNIEIWGGIFKAANNRLINKYPDSSGTIMIYGGEYYNNPPSAYYAPDHGIVGTRTEGTDTVYIIGFIDPNMPI